MFLICSSHVCHVSVSLIRPHESGLRFLQSSLRTVSVEFKHSCCNVILLSCIVSKASTQLICLLSRNVSSLSAISSFTNPDRLNLVRRSRCWWSVCNVWGFHGSLCVLCAGGLCRWPALIMKPRKPLRSGRHLLLIGPRAAAAACIPESTERCDTFDLYTNAVKMQLLCRQVMFSFSSEEFWGNFAHVLLQAAVWLPGDTHWKNQTPAFPSPNPPMYVSLHCLQLHSNFKWSEPLINRHVGG